jgi:hypothetical protein
MKKIINRLFSQPILQIEFSRSFDNYVVIRKDVGIVFTGDKEMCEQYVQHESLMISKG